MTIRIGLTPNPILPEEAAAKYEISFAAGADAVIDMDKFYSTIEEEAQKTDSVEIAALSSSNSEVASIKVNSININGGNHQCCIQDREYSEGEYS